MDFLEVANKLKTKLSLTVEELNTLKNGLIDNESNIDLVLNIHGALTGLIRELIGQDVKKQCAAAACCCNLALGDRKACMAISKAAGPYLIAALDSLSVELAVTCAWAIGNLAGGGAKTCEVLIGQGALSKLVSQLQSAEDDVQDAAAYALVHFTYQLKDNLKSEYMTKILDIIPSMDVKEPTLHLLFLLSCHRSFIIFEISEIFLQKLLDHLNFFMTNYSTDPSYGASIAYTFRFLGNINFKVVYILILRYFIMYNMVGNIKDMLSVRKIDESVLWMLGNMFNLCGDHLFFRRLLNAMS